MLKKWMALPFAAVVALPDAALAQDMAGSAPSAAAGEAPAQNASAEVADGAVEEIIVSARRVSETLQSVPIAVTALSGAALAQRNVVSLSNLSGVVPNLYFQPLAQNPQALTVAIRGQKQNQVNLQTDASVGVYVDGLYNPRLFGSSAAIVDVARLEVLRGPQGTLYGRNTTGGAISLYTKDPTDDTEAFIVGSLGNREAWSLTGMVNVPIAEDVGLRIVAKHDEHGPFGRDGLGRGLADDKNDYVRAKLKARIGDNAEALLFGSYYRGRSGGAIHKLLGLSNGGGGLPPGGPATLQVVAELFGVEALDPGSPLLPERIAIALSTLQGFIGGDPYVTGTTADSFSNIESHVAGLDIKIDLGNSLQLRSITGFQHFNNRVAFEIDGTPFQISRARQSISDRYYSQELQILGGDQKFNWIAGVYGGYEDGREITEAVNFSLVNPGNPFFSNSRSRNTSLAAFGQAIWEFVPGWRVTAGVRYSGDKRRVDVSTLSAGVCQIPAPGVPATGVPGGGASQCPRKLSVTFKQPSFLLSLDHKISEDVLAYAKVSRGYRSGGFPGLATNFAESFAPFKPEILVEYEVGLKSSLLDNKVRLNLAGYYEDYKDLQRTAAVSSPAGVANVTTNAAKARVFGAEGELEIRPVPALSLTANFGYTNAKYKQFVDLTGDRTNEDFGVPKWTGSIGGTFRQPTGIGEVSVSASYRYQSATNYGPEAFLAHQVTQRAYGLVDARVGLEITAWNANVALFGRNLTDKAYLAGANGNDRGLGYNEGVMGIPRMVGIEFTKRLGTAQ